MAAMALEPDSPGSLVGVGLIPLPTEASEVPIYRVETALGLRLLPVAAADGAICGR
jgi:hypothetical protein